MLEALWREALWLVHDDVATVAEIDDAVRYGPGLRWAIMGTFLTYRMAGGEEGMHHFMEQFGPALSLPWSKLVDVPELTTPFLEKLAAQSDAQADGRSTAELERHRDDCLVAVLHALRAHGTGAGETLAQWERGLLRSVGPSEATTNGGPPAPLRLLVREIPADWLDYNGHVTESRYAQMFGDATDALLGYLGVDAAYLENRGTYYTVETHISTSGSCTPEIGSRRPRRCSAGTTSACTYSTRSCAPARTTRWRSPNTCWSTSTPPPAEQRPPGTTFGTGSRPWPRRSAPAETPASRPADRTLTTSPAAPAELNRALAGGLLYATMRLGKPSWVLTSELTDWTIWSSWTCSLGSQLARLGRRAGLGGSGLDGGREALRRRRRNVTTPPTARTTIPADHPSLRRGYDGGGYPDGLKGEHIPLPSRIVFACDAYLATITSRPYAPSASERDARAELNRCAGNQFDPRVIDALLTELHQPTATQTLQPTPSGQVGGN